MIKVLLVEDEFSWQQAIAALLRTAPEIELVATVDNADDAEIFFNVEKPDVILIDWKIRGARDGLELAKSLESKISPCCMILVTGSPPEQIPKNPYGYVPKSRIASELLQKIFACRGGPLWPPVDFGKGTTQGSSPTKSDNFNGQARGPAPTLESGYPGRNDS